MKHESVDFQEIFGSTSVRESLDSAPVSRAIPGIALDDPLWLEQVTGTRSANDPADLEFIKEVLDCDTPPIHTPKPASGTEFTKRAPSRGLTRQELTKRMTPYYNHGLWKRWEQMMDACIGDREFDESKALTFLGVTA